ncbi:glutathione S-transferase family protein [Roseiterribacter gracilis]|uniref:Glutathione S-transferase n=1 Tax=Roseiterribacter gracilis TaxID=2812848 RepID=A0A8S8XI12_9PROT|nr:glutathione S-transferase [Rhodospirillales bacterium TMPK1]
MITLYHAPQSRSSRIIWFLEELQQPYEIRPVSIFRPMTGEGSPDAANPHPDKRVPVVVHDGAVLAESIAIFLYLTDAFPDAGLGPDAGNKARGDYLTWLTWYAAEMEPAMFLSFGNELDVPMKKRRYDAAVQRIEQALANGPYMLGDRFTSIDLIVASALDFGRKAFPPSAAIDAYIERCKTRPACVRAIALDSASGVQRLAA